MARLIRSIIGRLRWAAEQRAHRRQLAQRRAKHQPTRDLMRARYARTHAALRGKP